MPRDGKYAASTLLRPATSEALCRANSSSDSVARPAGFQKAASPRPAAAVAVCPIPTACAPTGNTRNSAPALRGGCCATAGRPDGQTANRATVTAAATGRPAVRPSERSSERLPLIDEHDGDVVFDGVHQAAGVTGQRFGVGTILERPLALGADEDLEEIRSQAHEAYPRRLSAGSLRR